MKNKSVILAKLDDRHGDLMKQWFIYYSVRQADGKMRRKREYEGINEGDAEYRKNRARILMDKINEKLLTGFDPWKEELRTVTDYDITLKAALTQACEQRIKNLRQRSATAYKSKLNVFYAWLDKNNYSNITMHQFSDIKAIAFLQSMQRSNTTINYYKAQLGSFFEDFVRQGKLVINPFGKIPSLKETRQAKLPFKQYHIDTLKPYITFHYPDLWLHIEFINYMATRPNEARLLRISDIDWDNRQLWIPGNVAKNKKTQFIDFPDHFFDKLKHMKKLKQDNYIFGKKGKPGPQVLSRDYYNRIFRDTLIYHGIDTTRYSLYSWKATGNVRGVRAGIPVKDMQEHNRHHDLETFDIYIQDMGAYPSDNIRTKIPVL